MDRAWILYEKVKDLTGDFTGFRAVFIQFSLKKQR